MPNRWILWDFSPLDPPPPAGLSSCPLAGVCPRRNPLGVGFGQNLQKCAFNEPIGADDCNRDGCRDGNNLAVGSDMIAKMD